MTFVYLSDYSLLENEDENHTESKSVHVEDNKEGEKPKDGNLAKNKEVPSFRIDFEEEQADEDDVFNQYLPKANNKGILPMDDTKEEKENTSNEQHKAVEDVSIQKKGCCIYFSHFTWVLENDLSSL